MAGYPPIDKLYYENPSLRIGGFIAWVLKKSGSNRLNIVPGKCEFCTITPKHFASLQELAEYLKQNHQDSVYYRGQTRRYETAYQDHINTLAEAFPDLSPLHIIFENMIPILFRPILKLHYPDWDSYKYPTKLDQIAPAMRAIFNCNYDPIRNLLEAYFKELIQKPSFLTKDLLAKDGFAKVPLPSELIAPMTNISMKLLQLISISQHYEYGSTMVDITSNVDVAVWFASHKWSGDRATGRAKDTGVIYRFNANNINKCLTKELENETPTALAISRSGLLGLTDISNMGNDFGRRPKAQFGGSIFGMENSIVYLLLDVYEAMEVFTFPLNSILGNEAPINKADLCPSQDSLLDVFNPVYMHSKEPIADGELIKFLKDETFSKDERGIISRARKMHLI